MVRDTRRNAPHALQRIVRSQGIYVVSTSPENVADTLAQLQRLAIDAARSEQLDAAAIQLRRILERGLRTYERSLTATQAPSERATFRARINLLERLRVIDSREASAAVAAWGTASDVAHNLEADETDVEAIYLNVMRFLRGRGPTYYDLTLEWE